MHLFFSYACFRSPGGTPFREKPKPSETNDAASMIANALKRKFANRVLHSPLSPQGGSDKENDNESPDSPLNPVSVCLFDFLLNVHGTQLRSCRDIQLT